MSLGIGAVGGGQQAQQGKKPQQGQQAEGGKKKEQTQQAGGEGNTRQSLGDKAGVGSWNDYMETALNQKQEKAEKAGQKSGFSLKA